MYGLTSEPHCLHTTNRSGPPLLITSIVGLRRSPDGTPVFATVRNPRHERGGAVAFIAAAVAAMAAAWLLVAGHAINHELGPVATEAAESLWNLISGSAGAKAPFTAAQGYSDPLYIKALGIASVVLLLVALPWALYATWRRRGRHPALSMLALAALIYPATLVLRLTLAGTETSNRASEFVFLGLAATIGVCFLRWLAVPIDSGAARVRVRLAATAVACVVVLGGITVGQSSTTLLPGSYVVGEETALLACLQGLRGTVSARPPFPAERGVYGMPTVVNNVETLCNVPFVATAGAAAYRALSPDTETTGSKLVCFNESFARPSVYEVPFGMTVRELCEEVAGGLRGGATIKAVQIGGPLGGILPASLLDTRFDFEPLAAVGCMVGHGSILAFDQSTDMRDVARHLLRFGADESCGKCFPCRIGLRRAYEEFAADAPVQRARLEDLLEALELGSLCAHGGGIPAPLRSLLTHFPDELGLA